MSFREEFRFREEVKQMQDDLNGSSGKSGSDPDAERNDFYELVYLGLFVAGLGVFLTFWFENWIFMGLVVFLPLIAILRLKAKSKLAAKRAEQVREHHMKKGDPKYWGRGDEKETNA